MLAIVLAYLFLQGNIGLSQVKHFCGDILALHKVGLVTPKASCGMESLPPSCEKPKPAPEKGCCHNEVQQLHVDQSMKAPAVASIDFVPLVLFFITFAFGRFSLVENAQEVALGSFSPPHRFTNLRLRAFLQVFRN